MLHAGKSIDTVQQILGYAAASTTVNIYEHVTDAAHWGASFSTRHADLSASWFH
jgi:site-specific recombinase XerD